MASKTTAWVVGASLMAAVIAAGAWFGVVSPTLSNAEQQRKQASAQRDQNDMLELRIAKLKAEYDNLDSYRAQIADLRTKIPTTGDLAELNRELQTIATAVGVTLSVSAPGTAAPFVAPAAAQPTPAPTESADATSTDTGATDDSAAAAAPATSAVDGMYTIPLSLTVDGTYDQTVAFIDALQQQMPRLYVLSGLNATSLKAAGAQGGRPAVNDGDLETVITGVVLTLEDTTSSVAPGDEATPAPTQLPVPTDQKNPFLPVGNS